MNIVSSDFRENSFPARLIVCILEPSYAGSGSDSLAHFSVIIQEKAPIIPTYI
jgi:hypothetical protein